MKRKRFLLQDVGNSQYQGRRGLSGLLGPFVQTRCSRIFNKYANKQNLFFHLSCVLMLKEVFHGLTVILTGLGGSRGFDPDLTLTVATC